MVPSMSSWKWRAFVFLLMVVSVTVLFVAFPPLGFGVVAACTAVGVMISAFVGGSVYLWTGTVFVAVVLALATVLCRMVMRGLPARFRRDFP